MTKRGKIILLVAGCSLMAAVAVQGGETTVAQGEKLFADPALGGSLNGRSCRSCHPQGAEGLATAGQRSDLAAVINRCLTGPLQGHALAEDSAEMIALRRYIQSLQQQP